jgi:DNA polymerase alpha subunit A
LETEKENLKIDFKYYLTQQIHPIVSRLCEPIEGIDAVHIATCLGLDPAAFKHKNTSSSTTGISLNPTLSKQQQKLQSYLNERENFKNCTPFKFVCPLCKTEVAWKDSFVKNEVSIPGSQLTSNHLV